MQRYIITSYDQAEPASREVYDEYMRLSGADEPPIWVRSLGHNPRLLKAYWEKTRGTLLEGDLPYVLKEMVVFVVSRVNGAQYCEACHAHAALQQDPTLTYQDLVTILDADSHVPLLPAHRAALKFAQDMAANANAIGDADFAVLERAGFTDAEIRELLSVIDMAMMFNCYTSASKLPLDPEYKQMLDA